MNDEIKHGLSKATDRAKQVFIIAVTAVLSAGAMYTFWLYTDNGKLTEDNVVLETRKQELEGDVVSLQADKVFLKEQALKENVFLTDRPASK